MFHRSAGLAALALAIAATPALLPAQSLGPRDPRAFLELRGGAVVPTFDIADVARTGPAFGATLGVYATPSVVLFGAFDYGAHENEAAGGPDITTLHYMAKAGYALSGPVTRGWETILNLGLGAVTFDVDGAPERYTYFAINAGAKIAYHLNPTVALVFSPQGDIAFSDEAEVGTDNAWVWPVSAGLRFSF